MKIRKLFSDKYIVLMACIALAVFVITALGYYTGFMPFAYMHSDGNGYYMYLPAWFVYKDPGIHFLDQLTADPSGFENTFYLMETGQVVDKYTMGVALLELPFFLVAHLLTCIFLPGRVDGYSAIYQLGMMASTCFYYFIGCLCTYKAGQKYASKKSLFWSVVLVTLGSGLLHYISRDGSYSHVYSFACIALFILLIQKFEEKPSMKLQLLGGLIFGMLTLIRVTNVVMVMIYVCFNVDSFRNFWSRLLNILKPKNWIGIAAGFILVWLPQLIYWKWAAGSFIVNSYNLPGNIFDERFYWTEPKILNVLFYINRGIFFWCPVIVLSALGFILCRKYIKELWTGLLVSLLLFIYIISAWWCYDGLCGFTNRFFVDMSGAFMLMMAVFWERIRDRIALRRAATVFSIVSVIWTNLFMIEYWFNETTKYDVHIEHILQVFSWYRNLIG